MSYSFCAVLALQSYKLPDIQSSNKQRSHHCVRRSAVYETEIQARASQKDGMKIRAKGNRKQWKSIL